MNKVKRHNTLVSNSNTYWTNCYLLMGSCRIDAVLSLLHHQSLDPYPWCDPFAASFISGSLYGVLLLLCHPLRWILGVPSLENFPSEKYSIISHAAQIKKEIYNSLNTAASSLSWSLHSVCSICTVIPQCAPSATSSITVDHQCFNNEKTRETRVKWLNTLCKYIFI